MKRSSDVKLVRSSHFHRAAIAIVYLLGAIPAAGFTVLAQTTMFFLLTMGANDDIP